MWPFRKKSEPRRRNVELAEPGHGAKFGDLYHRYMNSVPHGYPVETYGGKVARPCPLSEKPCYTLLLTHYHPDYDTWYNQKTNMSILDGPWGEPEYFFILENLRCLSQEPSPELKWARYVYLLLKEASTIDQCRISMSIDLRDSMVEDAPDAVRKCNSAEEISNG